MRQKRKQRRAASVGGGLSAGAANEVLLEWRGLTCTLQNKKAGWVGGGAAAALVVISMPGSAGVSLSGQQLECRVASVRAARRCLTPRSTKRLLLSGVSGAAAPGRLTAIMGPSGSGKTTLLSALAGQMPYSAAVHLCGAVTANGVPLQAAKLRAGFVQQDDLFYPQVGGGGATQPCMASAAARARLAMPAVGCCCPHPAPAPPTANQPPRPACRS